MRYARNNKSGLYRSRNGLILGVCKGAARYFDISVFWLRFIVLLVFIFTGFWPVTGVYVLAALLMKPEPILPISNESEAEFYNSYAGSRKMGSSRLKRKFDQLDRRLRRMEDIVTSRDFKWERRFTK